MFGNGNLCVPFAKEITPLATVADPPHFMLCQPQDGVIPDGEDLGVKRGDHLDARGKR